MRVAMDQYFVIFDVVAVVAVSYIRSEDFLRPSVHSYSVTLRLPPLDSEMGWAGELWSNCVFLILEN